MLDTHRLDESKLYLGDNGRAFCGKLLCAGMTAHYTGRDLSGQWVVELPGDTAVVEGIRCERCKMQPPRSSITPPTEAERAAAAFWEA